VTIAEYLVELRRHLRVGPLARRRILREVEAHLVDSAGREGSEESAVASFGPPEVVAARLSSLRRYPLQCLRPSVAAAASLGVGLMALLGGVSGTTWVTNRLTGCTVFEMTSAHAKGSTQVVLPETSDTSVATFTFSVPAAAEGPVSVRLTNYTITANRPNRCNP
jgi:hypothetical protein